VEGIPDREFYYLIGLRVKTTEQVIQHSLWADSVDEEKRIWTDSAMTSLISPGRRSNPDAGPSADASFPKQTQRANSLEKPIPRQLGMPKVVRSPSRRMIAD